MHIISKAHARHKRYEKSKYGREKKKLRVPLEIGEDVLLLSPRIKKKSDPGKFYKSTVDNRPFFDKKTIFTIIKKSNIDNWIKNKEKIKKLSFESCEKKYSLYLETLYKKMHFFSSKYQKKKKKKKIQSKKKTSIKKKFQ